MVVTTRLATTDDARGIATAHTRGWQVAYDGLLPAAYLEAIDLAERTELWRSNLAGETDLRGIERPTDFVAEVDGAVVGFANVGVFRLAPNVKTCGELWAMYVHPDHWGAGAGYALMQETMAFFSGRSYSAAYLWVLEENALARRFYERQGWKVNDETQAEDIGGQMIVERRYSIAVA